MILEELCIRTAREKLLPRADQGNFLRRKMIDLKKKIQFWETFENITV